MVKQIKEMAVTFVATVMFLYMVFAWVISLVLTVAVSPLYLLLIPLWFIDIWALNRLLKLIDRKCR